MYFSSGETGAGKSSLLNLIMGEHMLPREVLSSTSCICRIFNSEQKKAVVIDENDREIVINDVTKKSLSQYVCIDRSEKKSQRYKTVDIYWPVPMLKVTVNLLIMFLLIVSSYYIAYIYKLNISHISNNIDPKQAFVH